MSLASIVNVVAAPQEYNALMSVTRGVLCMHYTRLDKLSNSFRNYKSIQHSWNLVAQQRALLA